LLFEPSPDDIPRRADFWIDIAPQVVGRVSDPISGYLMVRGEIKQILEVRYVF
jgi:hypothetical protein